MAYINQDMKNIIAHELKKVAPKNLKFSLAIRDNQALIMTIRSFDKDFPAMIGSNFTDGQMISSRMFDKHNINNPEMKELFTKLETALQSAGWYNDSKPEVDHFDIAYYYYIHVGKWNKPFIVK